MEQPFAGVAGRVYQESTPAFARPAQAPAGAPNVVIMLLDDVGFAQLGCYGSDIQTPNMDRLAAGGLRYTNFHTTAMCSPTRAALLTGRNHHSVGMGVISEWSTGYPGYQGYVTKRAAMLSEMLHGHGYNSFCVGKWHMMPMTHATAAGPFDYWPLQRGFDRYYGFLAGLTDQWHPELHRGNEAVDAPTKPGYHLSQDLVDTSIKFIRDQKSAAPDKPFFLYLAFGAGHSPHHAPADYIAKYRGKYDKGWDVARRAYFERQRAMGIIPANTELAERDPRVPAWDEMSDDERHVCARFQEVFAGFLDHTDAQIGRLIDFLEQSGQLDNTIVILTSDNGASDEGGHHGQLNLRKQSAGLVETLEEVMAGLDILGSEHTYNHYPRGWANVGNTPLHWYKMDTHGGGIRDPFIVHWPAGIRDRGAIRTQYHHVTDVVPTILELVGVQAPQEHQGVAQMPIHGVSMAYSLNDANAPTRKRTQYYELLGDRAIWHDGWKAVTHHAKGESFDADCWGLYNLDEDFSECHDLAETHPERLQQLIDLWWAEAGRYDVLPLDDRDWERLLGTIGRSSRTRFTYFQGTDRVDRLAAPNLTNRSWTLTADLEVSAPGAEGVILSAGGRFGGYALFMKGGRAVFEYNYANEVRYVIESDVAIPPGASQLRLDVHKTGEHRAVAEMFLGDRQVGAIELSKTFPSLPNTQGIHCGRDWGTPVSEAYECPFTFTGTIHRVVIDVGGTEVRDVARETREAMADQ